MTENTAQGEAGFDLEDAHTAEAVSAALFARQHSGGPQCVVWGGSSVMGFPGVVAFPDTLAAITGLECANEGVSQQTSTQVAARQGARPAKFVVVGNKIPRSGSVQVAPLSVTPLQDHWAELRGSICGIFGTLRLLPDKSHEFVREEDGDEFQTVDVVDFNAEAADKHAGKIAILWMGRSNYLEIDKIVEDITLAAGKLGHSNYLVIGILNAKLPGHPEHEGVLRLNFALEKRFGERFVDIRKFFIDHDRRCNEQWPATSGVSPLPVHNIPERLRADIIHPNDRGNQLLSLLIADRLERLGICQFPHIHGAFADRRLRLNLAKSHADLAAENQVASETILLLRNQLDEAQRSLDAQTRQAAQESERFVAQISEMREQREKLERAQRQLEQQLVECEAYRGEAALAKQELDRFREAERALVAENLALTEAYTRSSTAFADGLSAAVSAALVAATARDQIQARLSEVTASRDELVLALKGVHEQAAIAAEQSRQKLSALEAEIATQRLGFLEEAHALTGRLKVMRDEQIAAEAEAKKVLDLHIAERADLQLKANAMKASVDELSVAAVALEVEREDLRKQIAALQSSPSWRFMAPLRGVRSAWMRILNSA